MRIIINNHVDAAYLLATPAMYATTPVENLQDQSREKVARTVDLTDQTIDVTLAAPAPISACVLYRGNFTSDATWRVKVYDTAAMGSLLYDSGAEYLAAPKTLGDLDWGIDALGASLFDGWGYSFAALWFPMVVGRFVRITLSDSANPDGYMEASRLFIGPYFETNHAPVPGASMQWKETTVQSRTDGGTLRSEPGVSYRAITVSGAFMPESDRIQVAELLRQRGLREDVYVSLFPELGNAYERDHQMQAKLVQLAPTTIPMYGVVHQLLQFEEI